MYTGKKNQPNNISVIIDENSNAAMAMPDAAPLPAKPIKCTLPILLANKEAPTFNYFGFEIYS
jgi:hypothetical protein